MKKILLLALLAVLAWWYFIGGRNLSEDSVRDFYQRQERATLSRDPEALCSLFDKEFTAAGAAMSAEGHRTVNMNKDQACDNFVKMYEGFGVLGEKMGGILMLDYSYEIHSISISADKKSAEVDVSYSLDVGGSILNLRSRARETLVRKNGRTLLARSEERETIQARK